MQTQLLPLEFILVVVVACVQSEQITVGIYSGDKRRPHLAEDIIKTTEYSALPQDFRDKNLSLSLSATGEQVHAAALETPWLISIYTLELRCCIYTALSPQDNRVVVSLSRRSCYRLKEEVSSVENFRGSFQEGISSCSAVVCIENFVVVRDYMVYRF